MTLKVGLAQAAAPTSTGTVDLTDSNAGFSSDVKAAIFFGSAATANDTSSENIRIAIGMNASTGGTTQIAVSAFADDARVLGTTSVGGLGDDATGLGWCGTASTFAQGSAVVSSWLSNGARLNFATIAGGQAWLINALLLGGDIEAEVLTGNFANGTPSDLTLPHGLSGTPEILVLLTSNRGTLSGGSFSTSMGFYDVASTTICGFGFASGGGVTPTAVISENSNVSIPAISGRTYAVQSVSSSDVVIRESTSNDSRLIGVLAIRGTSTALTAKAGFFTTKITSTGTQTDISGMSGSPQAVLLWGSRQTSVPNFLDSGGDCAAAFFGAAINNSGGSKNASISFSDDDNVTTTVSRSHTSNTEDIRLTGVDGVADVEASVSSWDSGGITHNYTNIGASAFQVGYLAFGVANSATATFLTPINQRETKIDLRFYPTSSTG